MRSVWLLVAFSVFVLSDAIIKIRDEIKVNALTYNDNTVTFKWYDNVTAEKVEAVEKPYPKKHLAQLTKVYRAINGTYFLEGTNFASQYPDSISWRPSGGFVDTVFYSYQKHHNLIIRPDDVWTAIITQFSLYVNANAEALRHSFVNFEGKKKLEVTFYQPIDQIQIREFIEKIGVLIDENIDPSISDWIKPDFTTTTENDRLTAGAALMATLQNYFEYGLSMVLCGIPEVTILGVVDDWRNIRQRVDKLKEFELNGQNVMNNWSSMLSDILDEFVHMKEGQQKNDEFWKQAIRVDYGLIDLGCSQLNQTYLNGWITAFNAFGKNGNWRKDDAIGENRWFRIKTNNLSPGVVNVPIQIYDEFAEPSKREYTGAIITGHMGHSVKMDEKTLQPLSGWGMTITNEPPGYLRRQNVQRRRRKTIKRL